MIVLGFDPGYGQRNATGWAILDMDVDHDHVMARGTLRAQGVSDDDRLASLVHEINALCQRGKQEAIARRQAFVNQYGNTSFYTTSSTTPLPATAVSLDIYLVAYELPFRGPNQRTVAGLARIGGMILASATLADAICYSVQPSEAKLALTGKGNADKHAMIAAAWAQFGLTGQLGDAEADAIGVALAGYARWKENQYA